MFQRGIPLLLGYRNLRSHEPRTRVFRHARDGLFNFGGRFGDLVRLQKITGPLKRSARIIGGGIERPVASPVRPSFCWRMASSPYTDGRPVLAFLRL